MQEEYTQILEELATVPAANPTPAQMELVRSSVSDLPPQIQFLAHAWLIEMVRLRFAFSFSPVINQGYLTPLLRIYNIKQSITV